MKTLRYYQRQMLSACFKSWHNHRRVLIQSPTGSGKGLVAAAMIGKLLPRRCLLNGDQRELVHQPLSAIRDQCNVIPALEQAEHKASLKAGVVVSSIQTLSKKSRMERFPPDFFKAIITDECHRNCEQKSVVHDYFYDAHVCGMTATPFRGDMSSLAKWYDDVAYSKTIMDFIEEGFAPPVIVDTIPIEIDLANVECSTTGHGRDFKESDLDTTILPYLEEIAKVVVEKASNRKTIAFLPLCKTSSIFAEILRRHGIAAQHVDGQDRDRDQKIQAFKEGRFQVLCNSKLVSTGVDIPIADCFLNLTPTRSAVFYQQSMGRSMRVLPGVIDHLPEKEQSEERRECIAFSDKPNILVLDLLWQNERFSVMHPGHLLAKDPEVAEMVFRRTKKNLSPEDLMAITKRCQEEREMQLVKALERAAAKDKSRHGIKANHVAGLLHDKKLSDYLPIAAWEQESPTEKQVAWLQKSGIDPSSIPSKGYATKLFNEMTFRFKYGLATIKQLRLIAKLDPHGEHNPSSLTINDAKNLIDGLMAANRRHMDLLA